MKRNYFIVIAVVILILVLGLFAIPALVDVNRYRPQIEARLETHFGREFSLGEMRLSLLPLAFAVNDVVIHESGEFQTGLPFARAATLYVRPRLFQLLRGEIELRSRSPTWSSSVTRTASGTSQLLGRARRTGNRSP